MEAPPEKSKKEKLHQASAQVDETKAEIKRPGLCNMFGQIIKRKPDWLFSFDKFVQLMYQPTDAASIGVCRMLFGFSMLLDIPEERGGANLDLRWGNPRECKFPLLPWLKPLTLQHMGLLYAVMYLGAIGIMLGYRLRLSCSMFAIPYWYILLLDKSVWNNHSYLYGLIVLLFIGSSSTNYCSVESKKDRSSQTVPYWNYFILKYQFFILYFVAGLKKLCTEWLSGHAMTQLSRHWVFMPFTLFLSTETADLLIVHWFGCFFDLTVAFLLLMESTRPPAMLFATAFHLMNSRLFSIGMFPWVCLAELPLFCRPDWPRKIFSIFNSDKAKKNSNTGNKLMKNTSTPAINDTPKKTTLKQKLVVTLLLTHCGVQAFLPYSHFITKGYNNWTEGLYGYSWDMMVHAWDTVLVSIRVVDNESNTSHYLDPSAWTATDRWSKHGDMSYQYAECLKSNLLLDYNMKNNNIKPGSVSISHNISIFIDVWCSLNGRFQQRMFDPRVDLLKVEWSPFKEVTWLLPLLRQFTDYRSKMAAIQKEVYSWSNFTEVLFVADFPGLFLENYISVELDNVTITVLHGQVKYEDENGRFSKHLNTDQHIEIKPGGFHKVYTVGNTPACYMYTYINKTRTDKDVEDDMVHLQQPRLDLIKEAGHRLQNVIKFYEHICNSILNVIFDIPMPKRVRIY